MSDLEEFAIPNYVSSDNSESESEDEEVDNKVIQRTWRHVETFDAAADAERKVERQGIWAKMKPYDTMEGKKQTYRCNKVPYRGRQCSAGLYLLYHSDSFQVSLFASKE